MTVNSFFIYSLAFTLLFTLSISSDPPYHSPSPSPSPSPQSGSDDQPPVSSPPVPPPASDLPPPSPEIGNSPTPDLFPSPSPKSQVADVSGTNLKTEESNETNSGGMSGGKKAGIAIGVIAAACVVGFGGVLYKKRQQNIQRAEFSSAARREFL